MKKILFLLTCMLCALFTSAQITLERQYFENNTMSVVKLEDHGYKYIGMDSAQKKVRLYNPDHSLWKEITLNIPAGYTPGNVLGTGSVASQYLFNTDAKVELLVGYMKSSGFGYLMHLIDENGTILQTFNNELSGSPVKVDGHWKLLTFGFLYIGTKYYSYTGVYALPGQYTGQLKVPNTVLEGATTLYPNPMENAAMLRYSMPVGITQGQIKVYNSAGALLRSYPVTSQSGELQIERGALSSGLYFYRAEAPGYTSAQESFIVR